MVKKIRTVVVYWFGRSGKERGTKENSRVMEMFYILIKA